MNEQAEIDLKIEELHQILAEDVDNHLNNREGLSENHHFELWDKMMELYKEQLKRKEKVNP
jgi:hypothetical protein